MTLYGAGWLASQLPELLPIAPPPNRSRTFLHRVGIQCRPGDDDLRADRCHLAREPIPETCEDHDLSSNCWGPAKILVVEDEMIVALDLKHTLERMGYTVVGTASSGEEAIRKVTITQPDLILMDINLNDKMDGIETARQIRNQQETTIIYLTAQSDEKTLQRARNTSSQTLLLKPFTESALRTALNAALCKTDD